MRVRLWRSPQAASEARALVERELAAHEATGRVVENTKLVVSELVSNAFRHGEGEIEMRLSLTDARVRVEVIDQGTGQAPQVRERVGDQVGGWGLQIVDRIARQWGVFEGTTHVWADFGIES